MLRIAGVLTMFSFGVIIVEYENVVICLSCEILKIQYVEILIFGTKIQMI